MNFIAKCFPFEIPTSGKLIESNTWKIEIKLFFLAFRFQSTFSTELIPTFLYNQYWKIWKENSYEKFVLSKYFWKSFVKENAQKFI